MDPGNWATDLAGGSKFGYQLVWVLVMSNLMAVLLQTLSARLGVVTGRDLAQACRDSTRASW
jgi:manganese transport protein